MLFVQPTRPAVWFQTVSTVLHAWNLWRFPATLSLPECGGCLEIKETAASFAVSCANIYIQLYNFCVPLSIFNTPTLYYYYYNSFLLILSFCASVYSVLRNAHSLSHFIITNFYLLFLYFIQ